MKRFHSPGLILHALPFQENDQILTLFTPEEGLIKLFHKGKSKSGPSPRLAPLMQVEAIFAQGRGALYKMQETTIIHSFPHLRQNLSLLEAAGQIVQALLTTQMPGKAAAELYTLALIYLNRLPEALDPLVISSSFQLKILRFEGLFSFSWQCEQCKNSEENIFIHQFESFCVRHSPPTALPFNADERLLIEAMALTRDFNLLASLQIDKELASKITQLFQGN